MSNPIELAMLDYVASVLKHFDLTPAEPALRGCPKNYSARKLGSLGTYLLHAHGVFWLLTANGGEFMVEKPNVNEEPRAVPLTAWLDRLNGATVAYRVATVLRGEAIDYDFEMTDEDTELLRNA